MNCVDTADLLGRLDDGSLPELTRRQVLSHIESCASCGHAARGHAAMRILRRRPLQPTPDGLFEKVMSEVTRTPEADRQRPGFWIGVSVGGALAAAAAVLVVTLGSIGSTRTDAPEIPIFTVAIGEPRQLHLAIDAEQDLVAATVSIALVGNVEIDGFGDSKSLRWTTNLEKGVNKLTLPIVALDADVGQLVVTLDHPDAQQEFRVDLQLGT